MTTDNETLNPLVKFRRPRAMTKEQLARHLEQDHSRGVTAPIIRHRWTKAELADTHRLIHLALGNPNGDHQHGTIR